MYMYVYTHTCMRTAYSLPTLTCLARACAQVVQQRDLAEANLFAYLVEDRASNVVSYVDFLCHIHSKIQVTYRYP